MGVIVILKTVSGYTLVVLVLFLFYPTNLPMAVSAFTLSKHQVL